jgi:hypothetical protein
LKFNMPAWVALTAMIAAGPAGAAIRMKILGGRPVVSGVYLNRHGPYQFLLDTGTTLNHLDPWVARSIGLKPTFRTPLLSATGTTSVNGADGIEVTLDTVRADGQTFLLGGLDAIQRSLPDVQGVLGQAFLSRFDYLLDLHGQRIEFGTREHVAGEMRTSFESIASRPVVSTSLGSLVLDSGTITVTLFGVRAPIITHDMFTLTGTTKVGTVSGKLVIGGRTFWHGEAVAIPRPAETGAAGLMPVSLFKAVYVCNSEGYLLLD